MEGQAKIKVMGIGDAGNNIINRMIQEKVKYVSFIEVNTDKTALKLSKTKNIIQIGKETTKGLGCGSDVSRGERAAKESKEEIKKYLQDTDMLFLTTGMGGGAGTGAIQVIAQIARDMGILTVGIVTMPFSFEGKKRVLVAKQAIEELRNHIDALIIISNDRLIDIAEDHTTIKSAFKIADEILKRGIQSITDLITKTGEINIDFADVKTIMGYKGGAYMGIGRAEGEKGIIKAVKRAIDNKLTEIKIDGAKGVIINFEGGSNLGLSQINDSLQIINDRISPDANIIFGTTLNENLRDRVKVTIIATGIEKEEEENINNQ